MCDPYRGTAKGLWVWMEEIKEEICAGRMELKEVKPRVTAA